jgi:hypothetical protein
MGSNISLGQPIDARNVNEKKDLSNKLQIQSYAKY